jgi:predicted amidohydrolase YtcJ
MKCVDSTQAEDLHTVDQEKIKDIEIARTVVGGAVTYQA